MKAKTAIMPRSGDTLEALVRDVRSRIDQPRADALFDVTQQIVDRMRDIGMTKGRLAEALGVPPSQVSRMLSGTNNFTVATLRRISEVLGCELEVRMPVRPAAERQQEMVAG